MIGMVYIFSMIRAYVIESRLQSDLLLRPSVVSVANLLFVTVQDGVRNVLVLIWRTTD